MILLKNLQLTISTLLAIIVVAGTYVSGQPGIDGIVTNAFFNRILNQSRPDCPGRRFYSRASFLQAARFYPRFGRTGNNDVRRREVAAFFAHVTHETGRFCYIEEIGGATRDYCDRNNRQYPCAPGRRYYGRGPIQISWNYNYGAAGRSIGSNLLSNPDTVARNNVIAWRTALWFWMLNCHGPITTGRGFGATIRAINGALECDGRNPATVTARVNYYTNYCRQLRTSPGGNVRC